MARPPIALGQRHPHWAPSRWCGAALYTAATRHRPGDTAPHGTTQRRGSPWPLAPAAAHARHSQSAPLLACPLRRVRDDVAPSTRAPQCWLSPARGQVAYKHLGHVVYPSFLLPYVFFGRRCAGGRSNAAHSGGCTAGCRRSQLKSAATTSAVSCRSSSLEELGLPCCSSNDVLLVVVPQSWGIPQQEGSNGRLLRSRDTRYGTRGPGSRADRIAKASIHGLLAGDDGASHRRRHKNEHPER